MKKILLILIFCILFFSGMGEVAALYMDRKYSIRITNNFQSDDTTLIADFVVSHVIEVDINGTIVWEYSQASTPIDIERLDNGNTLITESYGQERVIEVDHNGNVVWEYSGEVSPFHPADSERLENGNTLITFGQLNQRGIIEIDANGIIVWEYNCSGLFYTDDLERLENGNTLIIIHETEYNAKVIEVDYNGNVIWEYAGENIPSDAERLENNNTLITTYNGQVIEIDIDCNIVWEYNGAYIPVDIERLENGNTLITDRGLNCIIEVDIDGNIVWEYTMLDQPADAERIINQPLNNPPTVEIINPIEDFFHLSGIPLFLTPLDLIANTLSIGGFKAMPITINATDDIDSSANLNVKVYINGEEQGVAIFCPVGRVHEWVWSGWAFGLYDLKVTAEDSHGAISSAEMEVWSFSVLT